MTKHTCPFCSHTLLRHIRLGRLYWFCCHCHQEIPIAENIVEPEISLQNEASNAITERQQAEQELERLNQLKDDFLSTISHELRTPLANMKMAIQMLEIAINREGECSSETAKSNGKPSQVAHYLQILREECEREISLISELLELQQLNAGTQSLVLTTVRLQDWILYVVEPFAVRTRSQQQTLRVDISSELPPIATDLNSLGRILAELLSNACKYTPPGEQITLGASIQSGMIQLIVSNSGVEIPDDELSRIFDKFYRIKSIDPWKHRGTGLGLALARKLAAQLGGSIWAESASGLTWFTVELPDRKSSDTSASTDLIHTCITDYVNLGKTLLSLLSSPLSVAVEPRLSDRSSCEFLWELQQRRKFRKHCLEKDIYCCRRVLEESCTGCEYVRCNRPTSGPKFLTKVV